MPNKKSSQKSTCLIITFGYLLISGLWAFVSNYIFAAILNQPSLAQRPIGPGYWVFIALSTGMLFWLLKYWEVAIAYSQESLQKVNRSLRSFSACTKAMTKIDDEYELMTEICRICVEVGGHTMAWVAFGDDNHEKTLRPVAHWGAKGSFLDKLQASWKDNELGRGPAGTSIRTGKITVFHNLLTNPLYRPWREAVQKCGYTSCIALPLIEEGRVFGSLVIFDAQPHAFNEDEIQLLEELSEDLSYGIQGLRLKAASKREMEERFMLATVMDQTSDGVIIFDADGYIQYVNPSFEALCGVPADETVGIIIHEFECSQRNPIFYQAILKVFASNKVLSGHFVNKKRDGTEYDIDARVAPVIGASGEVVRYVATIRDVSEAAGLQRQLRQAQKMEALATLSGGIAHDFNNILAIIITNMEMTLEDVPEDSPLQGPMQLVLRAGLRGKNLVKQFLTISRQNEQPQKIVPIEGIVEECFSLLRSTLPTTIALRKDFNTEESLIKADPTQINQVIMNLCTNAGDAMSEKGGLLDISLTEVDLSAEEIKRYPGLKPGKYVKLIVADTGHGMSRDIMDRIFDPFYTTKMQGKGTGLGLSIVHGIVKNHGGNIAVNSIVDVGTTFTILFPKVEGEKKILRENIHPKPKAGQGHILFVDDEADYVTGMKIGLERLGYAVTAETDSCRTLELFRQNPEMYDLVITDQTMPHLTGVMLAQKLLAIRADIPIILCSGSSPGTDTAVSPSKAKAAGISEVLMKPVERSAINRVVQRLLKLEAD
ncbi:PAS domain S-box-containing protein [Desulfuromusa kysingii]|uniref:histidine kinase n=1 Tax=Desulfuromusa kysingii TaxID=37625 RepID=A0A1H4ALG0_9BACT|nr:ATP-binding protein [Desulfuromusa kysingii]SEA36637.1 PAS domain S-box-containing protein [Desulfuromusa kysingii]